MLHKQNKKDSETMQQRKKAGKEASKLSVQVLQVLRGHQQFHMLQANHGNRPTTTKRELDTEN
jgi:hypothetical protein